MLRRLSRNPTDHSSIQKKRKRKKKKNEDVQSIPSALKSEVRPSYFATYFLSPYSFVGMVSVLVSIETRKKWSQNEK